MISRHLFQTLSIELRMRDGGHVFMDAIIPQQWHRILPHQESNNAVCMHFAGQVPRSSHEQLSHLPLDKMATILADDNFNCIFLNRNDKILIRISLKFVAVSPIDNKPALVQVMAWHRTGDKPLPELMLTQFTDVYMQH